MAYVTDTLNWKEEKNGISVDCSLDIAVHPSNSNIILLIIPGVDGSLNGYKDKYLRIAESIQEKYGVAVVGISNPFISSFHWESNVRKALKYIEDNKTTITNNDEIEVRTMAHSVGAGVIAQIAWEYPYASRLLLINPAMKLNGSKIIKGLSSLKNKDVTLLLGSKDPSLSQVKNLNSINLKTIVLDGVDHNFSGESIICFIESPDLYLFNDHPIVIS